MVHANVLLLSNAQATTNAGVDTKVLYINRENLAITCTLALQIREKNVILHPICPAEAKALRVMAN